MRTHLLTTTSAVALLAATSAYAQNATWTGNGAPVTNEWTQANNWTPPSVPSGTATFTNNRAPTSVTISIPLNLNTILFTAGAPAYSFTSGRTINLFGAGIVNNSAFAPSFTNNEFFVFNSGTAGNAVITNNFVVNFLGTSSAGSAVIINNDLVSFVGTSTAAGVKGLHRTAGYHHD